jgi:hypothetical protein
MRSVECGRLGLPRAIRACLFDLDGVLTRTARVHAAAWKEMFDAFLRDRAAQTEGPFVPFDPVADYGEYIDGMLRYDGVRSFLISRGIELPEGVATDPPDANTVHGLGNRKNELVLSLDPDEGSRRLRRLGALRACGRRCRTRARCRLGEREHARRARGGRDRGSVRGANRRDRRCGAGRSVSSSSRS